MMNVNQWIGVGHVTRDPDIKPVGNSKVAGFRLAVNRSFKKGDEWVERPMFIDCEAWSHNAEKVEKSVKKGTEVFIRGRLELDEWAGKDGQERRSKHKIYVLELQVGKNRKGADGDEVSSSSSNSGNSSEAIDDMPF
jgi:single-strand DNA-binding protein